MLMEDSLTRRLHLLSCAQSQTRLNGKLLFTTHSQVMGNELKYQFTSLETSLKHLGKSKWQICTQYGFKRGRQPAVLKILQSVYHRSEVVSCIISYQFQYRPPHFVQENINHRHCIRISSCREACAAIFPNTALNNCYALACI